MRQSGWFFLVLVFLWSGCTCGKKEAETEAPPPPPTRVADEDTPLHELLDGDGELRASDETYGALALPVGLKLHRETEYLRVYRTHVPVQKLLQYFGPRLFTGRVDEIKGGAVYREASVRGAETAPFKLNVGIKDIGNGKASVAIKRIPQTPQRPHEAANAPEPPKDYWKTLQ